MNAEFNVWLLIVGLVVGAGLVWLVIMDSRRRESEIDAVERPREAAWLSAVMREDGYDVSPEAAERLLLLHRAYLDAPPPDAVQATGAEDLEEAPIDPRRRLRAPRGGPGRCRRGPTASTSDTPNVAPLDTPEIAGAGPTQNARSWLKNILPTRWRSAADLDPAAILEAGGGGVRPVATTTSSVVDGE